MKSTIIKPEEIFCDYLEGVKITGFKESDTYFTIQRNDEDPSNFYIELNDQGQSCYDGLDLVIVKEGKIIFQLNHRGQEYLDTEMIEIIDDGIDNSDYEAFKREIEVINRCLKNNSTQQ